MNRLALTTGTDRVPLDKQVRGYRFERDKVEIAGLTPIPSETVLPARALECPVQLETVLAGQHGLAEDENLLRGEEVAFEVRVHRVHVHPAILVDGQPDRVDPDKWRPLIMRFQKFYVLEAAQLHESRLSEISEAQHRSPDVDRARGSA